MLSPSTVIAIIKRNGGSISTSSTTGVRGWHNHTTGYVVRKYHGPEADVMVYWQNASPRNDYNGMIDLQKALTWITNAGLPAHIHNGRPVLHIKGKEPDVR